MIRSGAKVINFDAYEYFDTLCIYHEELKVFMQNGGYLAWGIVPTSDVIQSVDSSKLESLMNTNLQKIYKYLPEELVKSHSLITPSCGTGSRSIEEAIKIFQLTMRLKEALT